MPRLPVRGLGARRSRGFVLPPPASVRDRKLLKVIAALLVATREFDAVATTGLPEDRGLPASDVRLATLELAAWDEEDQSNDYATIPQDRSVQFVLHVIVRMDDADQRDDEADRLVGVCQNAIAGQSLGGVAIADWTRLKRGQWLPAAAPERRVRMLGTFTYQISNFDAHDTTV